MSESSYDLVAANAARVRDILRIIGADDDIDSEKDGPVAGHVLDQVDDPTARGISSLWNS